MLNRFIGKMGSSTSRVIVPALGNSPCFVIERMFDSNCDYLPTTGTAWDNIIKIGIWNGGQRFKSEKKGLAEVEEEEKVNEKENPLSNQGIRIGASPIYPLKSFIRHENSVEYGFDKNINLLVAKTHTGEVYYQLVYPEQKLNVTRVVIPQIRRFYKPIGPTGNSPLEIDEVATIFSQEINQTEEPHMK
jgi:hypothetical protein